MEIGAAYARHTALAALRADWERFYRIWWESGQFCAERRDTRAVCRRPEARKLHQELAVDYQSHPVRV